MSGGNTFIVRFSDLRRDSEAIFVDQRSSGRVYMLTKGDGGRMGQYEVNWRGGELFYVDVPEIADALFWQPTPFNVHLTPWVTGADMTPQGDAIIVRSDSQIMSFSVFRDGPVEDAMAEGPCYIESPPEREGAGVAFAADGSSYLTVSPGDFPPVWWFAIPSASTSSLLLQGGGRSWLAADERIPPSPGYALAVELLSNETLDLT